MLTKLFLITSLLLLSLSANAAMYKCKGADGSIAYSQMPCPEEAESKTIKGPSTKKVNNEMCSHVQAFAADVAGRMRSSKEVKKEIDRHGGINAIPKGRLAIINYVYSFRLDNNISPVRVGSLATAKCNSGSFTITRSDIPEQYFFAPEDGYRYSELPAREAINSDKPTFKKSQSKKISSTNDSASRSCNRYKRELKDLEDRMRGSSYSASQGEKFRDKRRRYKDLIREYCK